MGFEHEKPVPRSGSCATDVVDTSPIRSPSSPSLPIRVSIAKISIMRGRRVSLRLRDPVISVGVLLGLRSREPTLGRLRCTCRHASTSRPSPWKASPRGLVSRPAQGFPSLRRGPNCARTNDHHLGKGGRGGCNADSHHTRGTLDPTNDNDDIPSFFIPSRERIFSFVKYQ